MWNDPPSKGFFQTFDHAERCGHMSGLSARFWTAGLDEVRDASGWSTARALSALTQATSLASGFRPVESSSASCTSPLPATVPAFCLA